MIAEAATATLRTLSSAAVRRTTGLVGCAEPLPGSTVNANALESPRSGNTAVVDGATVLASIVPAECGPLSSISHIWYTVPGAGGGTLFITSTPASFSRENTTVAVPPDGMSPDTVRTSGAANTCSAVDGVAAGRIASPTPRAPSPITNAAAAASTVLRQRPPAGAARARYRW